MHKSSAEVTGVTHICPLWQMWANFLPAAPGVRGAKVGCASYAKAVTVCQKSRPESGRHLFRSSVSLSGTRAVTQHSLETHIGIGRQPLDYWTPQILPLSSPFHRPLTPNALLGSSQTMKGPAISNCPEADANLWVPCTISAVAL